MVTEPVITIAPSSTKFAEIAWRFSAPSIVNVVDPVSLFANEVSYVPSLFKRLIKILLILVILVPTEIMLLSESTITSFAVVIEFSV